MIKKITPDPDLISIAPMLDWTDKHFRYFMRLITRRAMLYTEMVACPALILGDRQKLLDYNAQEHPITLQVGGSDAKFMGDCASFAKDYGYDAVNVNAGCPSSRVQAGKFGAILMKTPELVADIVANMKARTKIPVTVKTRISLVGADGDGFDDLFKFANLVKQAGCDGLIVHARQAKLNISPKDNRAKLPLNYETVYKLKKSFPDMFISINGNVMSYQDIYKHLGVDYVPNAPLSATIELPPKKRVDGVMIGRWAYGQPYALAQIDSQFFGDTHTVLSRPQILESMIPYLEKYDGNIRNVTHHMMGLYHGMPNAKSYKQMLMSGDLTQFKEFVKHQIL